MKIEQIEKNRIQIIFYKEDLDNNKIDLHSIMCDSKMTQDFFLAILEIAKNEIGFDTENYDIALETISFHDNSFIITISRNHNSKYNLHKMPSVSRLVITKFTTYKFNNFDDFYEFYKFIKLYSEFNKSLYFFNNDFYCLPNGKIKGNNLLFEYASPSKIPGDLIKNYGKKVL